MAFKKLSTSADKRATGRDKSSLSNGGRTVVWDVADGTLSSRRNFAAGIAVALLGASSLSLARAAEKHLQDRSLMKVAASCPAGTHHSDLTGKHTDLPGPPHADGTPHSDNCIPNG